LRTAYSAANHLVDSDPILQVESAENTKGRLISWATDLAFVRLIQTGQLHLTLTGDRSQVQLAVSLNFACRIQLLPCASFLAPIGNLLLLGSVTIGNSTIRLL
jgi:hypothetical protein